LEFQIQFRDLVGIYHKVDHVMAGLGARATEALSWLGILPDLPEVVNGAVAGVALQATGDVGKLAPL
jgi:hypothetical protein